MAKAKKPVKKAKKAVAKKAVTKKSAAKKTATKKVAAAKKVVVAKPKQVSATLSNFFSPLGNRVLVKESEESRMSPGGIIIPDSALDKPLRGKVLAVGPGQRNKKGVIRPIDVKVGEVVAFGPYSGSKVTFNQQDYLLLSEEEIIGIVEN